MQLIADKGRDCHGVISKRSQCRQCNSLAMLTPNMCFDLSVHTTPFLAGNRITRADTLALRPRPASETGVQMDCGADCVPFEAHWLATTSVQPGHDTCGGGGMPSAATSSRGHASAPHKEAPSLLELPLLLSDSCCSSLLFPLPTTPPSVPDYCTRVCCLRTTRATTAQPIPSFYNPAIMSAEVQEPLTKVDSAVDETAPASPGESKVKHRRTSSTVSGVFNINDLGELSCPSA